MRPWESGSVRGDPVWSAASDFNTEARRITKQGKSAASRGRPGAFPAATLVPSTTVVRAGGPLERPLLLDIAAEYHPRADPRRTGPTNPLGGRQPPGQLLKLHARPLRTRRRPFVIRTAPCLSVVLRVLRVWILTTEQARQNLAGGLARRRPAFSPWQPGARYQPIEWPEERDSAGRCYTTPASRSPAIAAAS